MLLKSIAIAAVYSITSISVLNPQPIEPNTGATDDNSSTTVSLDTKRVQSDARLGNVKLGQIPLDAEGPAHTHNMPELNFTEAEFKETFGDFSKVEKRFSIDQGSGIVKGKTNENSDAVRGGIADLLNFSPATMKGVVSRGVQGGRITPASHSQKGYGQSVTSSSMRFASYDPAIDLWAMPLSQLGLPSTLSGISLPASAVSEPSPNEGPTTGQTLTSVTISSPHFIEMAQTDLTSTAIDSWGRVWAWGSFAAQSRSGNSQSTGVPAPINQPNVRFSKVSSSEQGRLTSLLDENGNVWSYGVNYFGGFGNDEAGYSRASLNTLVPATMPTGVSFEKISVGMYSTFALTPDGKLYGWGNPGYLGIDVSAYMPPTWQPGDPIDINDLPPEFMYSDEGELTVGRPILINSTSALTVIDVSAGYRHSLVTDALGNVWEIGMMEASEGHARCVDGDMTGLVINTLPELVTLPHGVSATSANAVYTISTVLDTNGRLWNWGCGFYFPNGVPLVTPPSAESYSPIFEVIHPNGAQWVNGSSGMHRGGAIDSNGHAWLWGVNGYGELGLPNSVIEDYQRNQIDGTPFDELDSIYTTPTRLNDSSNSPIENVEILHPTAYTGGASFLKTDGGFRFMGSVWFTPTGDVERLSFAQFAPIFDITCPDISTAIDEIFLTMSGGGGAWPPDENNWTYSCPINPILVGFDWNNPDPVVQNELMNQMMALMVPNADINDPVEFQLAMALAQYRLTPTDGWEPQFTPTAVTFDGLPSDVTSYDPQTGVIEVMTPAHTQGIVDVDVQMDWSFGPRRHAAPTHTFAQSFEFKTSASVNLQIKAYRDAARTIEIPQNGFIKHGTQVYWDFIVTNDGPEDLTDLTVTDTHITGVICTIDGPLASGATQTCQTSSVFE